MHTRTHEHTNIHITYTAVYDLNVRACFKETLLVY